MYAFSEAEVQKEISSLNKNIEKIVDEARGEQRKLEEIIHQAKIKQFYVDYAEKLLNIFKLDPISLQTIINVAENFGEPTIILQALNTYGNLTRLKENVQKKLEALKTYNEEIITLQAQKENNESQIADLYRRLGIIEEKQRESRILQNIANLLRDPSNADIPPREFMLLSLALLIGIRDFSFTHSTTLPKWNAYVKSHLDTSVENLNNIVSGKL